MARLGDRGALWIWMAYVRWPLFALILGLIGLVLGVAFGGFVGLVMGLMGGVVFGALLGFAMGKDTKKFPVIVEKIVAYGGGSASFGGKFVGRVVTHNYGENVEKRGLEFLDGMTLKQLPNFSLPVWFKDTEDRPRITVAQVDSHTYLACIWNGLCLVAKSVPVYASDEAGNVLRFKYDSKAKDFVKNEEGKLIEDANGEPYILRYEDKTLINLGEMNEDGKIVKVPMGELAKLDNDRVTYTQAARIAAMMNTQTGWFNKWGSALVAVLCVLIMALIFIFGVIKFGEQSASFAEHMDNANAKAVQGYLEAERQHTENLLIINDNLKIMQQMGYTPSQAFQNRYGSNASSPTVTPTPAPQLRIPFVG